MPFLLMYVLKLSLSLAVVFLFYQLVLRKLTFYNWNRWYLLGYSLLSFFIPFIDISKVLRQQDWTENSIVQWVPVIQTHSTLTVTDGAPSSFSTWSLVGLLILTGMLFMLVRLLIQFISFHRMLKKAEPLAIDSLQGSRMKLYQVNENIIPFSFGHSIFINHHLHTREELQEIVWHEFIHVKQQHSFDIIFGELLCLLNWFNPFAWLLRRSIRQNLEFIADNKVLENGIGRREYQYLLLKVIGNNHFSIAPKFNFSSLKKRIAMMNKMKSAGVHLVKFLFILPLAAVLLVAFRNQSPVRPLRNGNGMLQDTIPRSKKNVPRLPESIASISVTNNNQTNAENDLPAGKVLIKRKDGGKETYELGNTESMLAFEKKYGVKLEDILPPPPPPPPAPLKGADLPAPPPPPPHSENNTVTIAPGAQVTGNYSSLWSYSHDYEISDKKAVIRLLNGTVEEYDLTDKAERLKFENKYGKQATCNSQVNTQINTDLHTAVATNVNAHVNSNIHTQVQADIHTNVNTSVNTQVAPVAVTPALITSVTPAPSRGSKSSSSITPAAMVSAGSGSNTWEAVSPRPASLVQPTGNYTHVITGNEDIIVTITGKTTRPELDQFISKMKEKGIELKFDDIEYNAKGILVHINGTMRSGDSRSQFSASDFEKLVLAMIKKGDQTFFKVSTRKKEVI